MVRGSARDVAVAVTVYIPLIATDCENHCGVLNERVMMASTMTPRKYRVTLDMIQMAKRVRSLLTVVHGGVACYPRTELKRQRHACGISQLVLTLPRLILFFTTASIENEGTANKSLFRCHDKVDGCHGAT
jgi:hypothetical protein